MDLSVEEVVKRVLAENDADAERVLCGLLQILIDDHADAIAQDNRPERISLLNELTHMMAEAQEQNEQAHEKSFDDDADDHAWCVGLMAGDKAAVCEIVGEVLGGCHGVAERYAEELREERAMTENHRPIMRLVRE